MKYLWHFDAYASVFSELKSIKYNLNGNSLRQELQQLSHREYPLLSCCNKPCDVDGLIGGVVRRLSLNTISLSVNSLSWKIIC